MHLRTSLMALSVIALSFNVLTPADAATFHRPVLLPAHTSHLVRHASLAPKFKFSARRDLHTHPVVRAIGTALRPLPAAKPIAHGPRVAQSVTYGNSSTVVQYSGLPYPANSYLANAGDGTLWLSEYSNTAPVNVLGSFNLSTGTVTQLFGPITSTTNVDPIVADGSGSVWVGNPFSNLSQGAFLTVATTSDHTMNLWDSRGGSNGAMAIGPDGSGGLSVWTVNSNTQTGAMQLVVDAISGGTTQSNISQYGVTWSFVLPNYLPQMHYPIPSYYYVGDTGNSKIFRFYRSGSLDSAYILNGQPAALTTASDGTVWASLYVPSTPVTGDFVKLDPSTRATTYFTVPDTMSQIRELIQGPNNKLYFASQGSWSNASGPLFGIGSVDAQGNIAFVSTSGGACGSLYSMPEHITVGPDGNIWYMDGACGVLGMVPASSL